MNLLKDISNKKDDVPGISSLLDSLDSAAKSPMPKPEVTDTTGMAGIDAFMGPPQLDQGGGGGGDMKDIMKMLPQLLQLIGI